MCICMYMFLYKYMYTYMYKTNGAGDLDHELEVGLELRGLGRRRPVGLREDHLFEGGQSVKSQNSAESQNFWRLSGDFCRNSPKVE